MGTDRADVLIAGGGFAGLALALALSKAFDGALSIIVADAGPLSSTDPRASDPDAADPRASALAGGSRRMLEVLDVWEALAPHAQPVTGIDLTDSSLRDAIRPVLMSYDPTLADGTPGMTIVENARLRSVLLAAVLAAPGVRLAQVTRLISAAPARSRIIATTAIGTTIKAALLISAEGRASALREAAGIKGTRWHHGQTGIVTAVRLERDHGGRALQHFLPGGPFALLPLPAQRACVTWSEADAVAAPLLTAGDTAFKMALEDRLGGQFGRVALDGPRRSWPLETYLARSLIADRFALIGDSARSVHPIAGQGLNLGFRDVAALVQAMVDAARTGQDIGAAPVLEAYQQRRRLDGVMSATAFDGLNRLFSSDVAVLRTARDAGLGLVERLPMLKRWFVAEASGETGDVPRLLQGVMP